MAWRPRTIVAWVSSFVIVSLAAGPGTGVAGSGGAAPAGRGHVPNLAITSRRASSTVTAPTTAITVVSGRTYV